MVRYSQLKSVSIVLDGRKYVAERIESVEGILKGNRDQRAVSLKRTLHTFFRQKVCARRVGEKRN